MTFEDKLKNENDEKPNSDFQWNLHVIITFEVIFFVRLTVMKISVPETIDFVIVRNIPRNT